jgi:Response regulator containing a CheY-like receiver domain and an HTH DNA-binding domain
MLSITSPSPYQILILSDNYYLNLGLKHLIYQQMSPRPDIIWLKTAGAESLARLRETVLKPNPQKKWIVFADRGQIESFRLFLPSVNVCLLPSDLSLTQIARRLKVPDFSHIPPRKMPLTPSELRVCSLFIKGFSVGGIARILRKSPKTIHTHKRNAMDKFHSQNLADFHRKISLMPEGTFCP